MREVFTEAQRERFVRTVAGGLAQIERPEVLERALWYWSSVDAGIGQRIEQEVARLTSQAAASAAERTPLREGDSA